jgi:Conserved oligomeric complex COG6
MEKWAPCILLLSNLFPCVCSDMLAWVHQSLASERELLVALFGGQDAAGAPGSGAAPTDMPSMPALLDRVFESICKPLKVCSAYTGSQVQQHAICTMHGAASCDPACKCPSA